MYDNYDHISEYLTARINDPNEPEVRNLIADFALLWNQYERALYNEEENVIKNIDSKIEKYQLDKICDLNLLYSRLEKYVNYREHQFTAEQLVEMFNRKDKKNGNAFYKQKIEEKMVKNESKDKIWILLFIAARVRNNMFHGSKGPWELPEQKELFKICNELLMNVLEKAQMINE